MKIWLSAAVAACIFVLATAGIASASNSDGHSYGHGHGHGHHHDGHGHGKPHLPPIDTSNAANCDFIAEPGNALCLLPFPDDYYTRPDASSPTGRRVDLTTEGMPANAFGVHIDATPYNASDGFSPGATILLKVPGIDTAADVRATGAVPINHLRQYRRPNAPVVVIDATTGKRWPIWVEIDSNAADPAKAALEIHPAVNFASGHRYVVALRDLRNAAGEEIEAPAAFRYYRDNVPSKQDEINARRKHFKGLFKTLHKAGIDRKDLYLAWDFTVASDQNNAGRELAMRDDAFAQLGDTDLSDLSPQGISPTFEVTSIEEEPNPGQIARRVKGNLAVPCYLFPNCGPGGTMQLDSNGDPIQNGVWSANFDCIIPASVTGGPAGTGRPSLYGHGLFGSASEVGSSPQRELAQAHGIVFCATDEIGMSQSDLPVAIGALQELSRFPALPDRLQQGLLDEMFLGRAMISGNGFTTDPAFHQDGTLGSGSVLDTSHLYYNGNSQGGIMGGALTAVTPDFTRASLGVPAMNYSVLLPRSVDFDPFAAILYPSYPDEISTAAGARPDPDALGPRRPERIREPDDRQPAARHPGPPGAAERRLRRPPGDRLPGGRRGPHGRRPRPPAGPLPRPVAGHQRPLAGAGDPSLPLRRLRRLLLGHRADPRRTGRDRGRHRPPALREPAEPKRRRPARGPAGDPGRAAAGVGLLRRGDPGKRQLRRRSLLRDRVQRALARGG